LSAAAFAVAGVSAVAIMPTTSEAIPAFARQTGAACLSCHFQTFPALTSFGRSFKLNAFTDVGEQALIEDEGLSLPSVMNASLVLRAGYTISKVTTTATATAPASTVSTRNWAVPTDSNLLLAGRVGANVGAFVEFAGGAGNWQMMSSFDFDGIKAGLNIANTGFGPTAALETTAVYGQHSGKLGGGNVSAVNTIIGGLGQTTSVALWTGNETFTLQGAMVAYADARATTDPSFIPLIRGTYVADLGGAELLIGATLSSGTQSAKIGGAPIDLGVDLKWVDVQIQGEMGDASYGIYADFVTTKARSAGAAGVSSNIFAPGFANAKRDGFGIRAEFKPLHHILFGVGYMSDKTTALAGAAAKTTTTHLAATYELYQNMEINLVYDNMNTPNGGKTTTTLLEMEALL
ncbi:MAG: hypothetical protein Q9M22_01510, partial [Mariprofundaceae bacterium]|nr:hypothetical protein [Mariprofundaceae bacterium]